jgi:hypothetical protein
MKSEMFVISLLLVICAFIGIATAMESVNPFNVPDDFSEWPDETAPTRIPGLNPFQHYDIVFPTPTDNQEYDPGIRWERPVRTNWINQTSIDEIMNRVDSVPGTSTSLLDRSSFISSRLSRIL